MKSYWSWMTKSLKSYSDLWCHFKFHWFLFPMRIKVQVKSVGSLHCVTVSHSLHTPPLAWCLHQPWFSQNNKLNGKQSSHKNTCKFLMIKIFPWEQCHFFYIYQKCVVYNSVNLTEYVVIKPKVSLCLSVCISVCLSMCLFVFVIPKAETEWLV